MNLVQLYQLCQDKVALLAKLQEWGLVPNVGEYLCPKCSQPLSLTKDASKPDGYRWFCSRTILNSYKKRVQCKQTVAFRTGTFFSKSKLSIFQILGFAHLWCQGASSTIIVNEVDIDKSTAVHWSSFCREVVHKSFMMQKERLGGPDVVVEIDESKWGKRKYHRGHQVEGQWVFGGLERGTGRVFFETVEDRGAETLLPIIKQHILPGTTIISDYWKAYSCLSNEGYTHLRVNHKLNFKDPDTGAHSTSIESSWRAAKATVASSGRKKEHLPGFLAHFAQQNPMLLPQSADNRCYESYKTKLN